MARTPSVSGSLPGDRSAGQRDGKARPDNAAVRGRDAGGGAAEDDAAVEGAADPWAETGAGHPDESASDSLDDHPQPEDDAPPRPGR